MDAWIDALRFALGDLFLTSPRHSQFVPVSGAALFAFLIVGRMLATKAFKSERGFFGVAVGMFLCLCGAVLGVALSDLYVIDRLSSASGQAAAKYGSGAVFALLVVAIIAKRLLGLSRFKGLIALILALAAGCGVAVLGRVAADTFGAGAKNAEQYRESLQDT